MGRAAGRAATYYGLQGKRAGQRAGLEHTMGCSGWSVLQAAPCAWQTGTPFKWALHAPRQTVASQKAPPVLQRTPEQRTQPAPQRAPRPAFTHARWRSSGTCAAARNVAAPRTGEHVYGPAADGPLGLQGGRQRVVHGRLQLALQLRQLAAHFGGHAPARRPPPRDKGAVCVQQAARHWLPAAVCGASGSMARLVRLAGLRCCTACRQGGSPTRSPPPNSHTHHFRQQQQQREHGTHSTARQRGPT